MGIQQNWSLVPGSNQTADSGINMREGQGPSTVNDGIRQMMARVKAFQLDRSGSLVTAGTSAAFTLTTNEVFTSLVDGMTLAFRPHVDSGASPTLAPDGLSAAPLVASPGVAVSGLRMDVPCTATYRAAGPEWLVHGAQSEFAAGTRMTFQQTAAPLGWVKETDAGFNNVALRIVTGSVVGGGSTSFSGVFAARTITQGNLPSVNLSGTTSVADNHSHGGSTASGGLHSHGPFGGGTFFVGSSGDTTDWSTDGSGLGAFFENTTSVDGAHVHGISLDGCHGHDVTVALGGSGTPLDFDVAFKDVIIAAKG